MEIKMKIQVRRKEITGIISALGQVKGMKDYMKAISLGRDLRKLKELKDETDDALKACKPESYDELQNELQELVQKKAGEYKVKEGEVLNENAIMSHVLLTWAKSKDWRDANKAYNEAAEAISNQTVDFDAHTELEEKDLPKSVEDVAVAEVLGWFMKS